MFTLIQPLEMICKFVLLIFFGPLLPAVPDPAPACTATNPKPRVGQMEARWKDNRIKLDWTVLHNEQAYLFQVERSLDGRHFTMAGMVFGTDKRETEQYSFYEPGIDKRVYYRLRILDKNNENSLTRIVEIRKDGSVTFTIPQNE